MTHNRFWLSALPPLAALALLLIAPAVFFVFLAAVIVALGLRAGGGFLSLHLHLGDRLGVGAFLLSILAVLAGLGLAFAPGIAAQIDSLAEDLPRAIAALTDRVAALRWLEGALRQIEPEQAAPAVARGAGATLAGFGAALGGFVITLFIALYLALAPEPYRRGTLRLIPPEQRAEASRLMSQLAQTLRGWILARVFSMAVVGSLTGLGLWAAGLPLAGALGLITGLLGFIPNLGAILSAVPALLIASLSGGQSVLIVAAILIAVQTVETYALTPLVEAREVSLPPALVLAAQLFMGSLYGVAGLALASPLAAILLVLGREVLVRHWVEGPDRVTPRARTPAPRH